MGSHDSVELPEQSTLTLDCLPYAISSFGMQANLSTIQWFRIATRAPEVVGIEAKLTDNSTQNIFLAGNKERLLISLLTIATAAQVGTEAAYRCQVCRNSKVPPKPLMCANTSINVSAQSELATSPMHTSISWNRSILSYQILCVVVSCRHSVSAVNPIIVYTIYTCTLPYYQCSCVHPLSLI